MGLESLNKLCALLIYCLKEFKMIADTPSLYINHVAFP